jgi:hypothetical protein
MLALAGTGSIVGSSEMAPSDSLPTRSFPERPDGIPVHEWVEAVHYALEKRSESFWSHREGITRWLRTMSNADNSIQLRNIAVGFRESLNDIEIEADRVFENAYRVSLHHMEGESVDA